MNKDECFKQSVRSSLRRPGVKISIVEKKNRKRPGYTVYLPSQRVIEFSYKGIKSFITMEQLKAMFPKEFEIHCNLSVQRVIYKKEIDSKV